MAKKLMIAPYGLKAGSTRPHLCNPTQKKVSNWVEDKRKIAEKGEAEYIPILYLQGGVGSGKTRAILAPVIKLLCTCPGIRVLWGRQDFKDLKLSVMDTFFSVMPPELIADKSEQYHYYDIKAYDSKTKKEGTSRIYFSGLKDISGLGSQEFAVIVITEAHETQDQSYHAVKRRCRQEKMPNMILIESEPPNEDHYLSLITKKGEDDYDPTIEKWEVSTYENWDNLPQAYRGSLESMPKSWQRKYLLGRTGFIPDGKPFYSGFNSLRHVRELTYIPNKTIYRGIDFGFHHPACLWMQKDVNDRFMVLKELMGREITIDKFAPKIIEFENEHFHGHNQYETYYDPAGNQVNDKSEKTSVEVLADHGIHGYCKQSTYRERKEIIERKLATMHGDIPALIVDKSCRTIEEGFLGGYHYPQAKAMKQTPEEPVRDGFYEHLMNCMEYIIVNLCDSTGHTADMSDAYVDYEELYHDGYILDVA